MWLSAAYARLCVVSTGPLLVGAEGPRSARLELARVPRVPPEGDLDAARAAFWPTLPELRRLALGVGSPAPALVVVGERDPYDRLPFLAKSGVWLFRALRLLGWDELSVYVTNALDHRKHLRRSELRDLAALFARYDPAWLAVGEAARDALGEVGVPCRTVTHPAAHRRFRFRDGPEGFGVLLREAGLEPGPWLAKELPGEPGGDPVLVDRFQLPRSTAYRVQDRKPDPDGVGADEHLDPAVVERARRAFVLGEAVDYKAAAKAAAPAGSRYLLATLAKVGRRQNWAAERAVHLARIRDAAKDQAVEFEARATVQARRLAWAATTTALAKYVRQLGDEHAVVKAQDVKAIGDFALSLSERGDTRADAEREVLRQLPLPELAKRLQETAAGLFGEEVGSGGRAGGDGGADPGPAQPALPLPG